jgi:DNA-3-methyladenine glycosylase II
MTLHLNSQADLEDAIRVLLKQDPRLQPVFAVAGMPALRRREPGFQGLAHIVCGQQLSTASASAIWARLIAAFDPFHHDILRRARADRLGRLGLSAAKIKTLKNLAREIAAERVNLDVLAKMPTPRIIRSFRCMASVPGRPTCTSYFASAMAMPGRPATSRCRRR